MKNSMPMHVMVALLTSNPAKLRVARGKRVYRYTKCPLPECENWHWYGVYRSEGAGTMERPRIAMYCCRDHALENQRRLNNARQRRWQREFRKRHGMHYATAVRRGLTGSGQIVGAEP